MKRREFVNFVGLGCLATSLPVAIAACTPTDSATATDAATDTATDAAEPTPSEPAPVAGATADATAESVDSSAREDGFAALGTVADLDAEGFLASETFVAGPVIVVRDPANADSVVALNSTCTHSGCIVEWKNTEFVCPCHASKFTADGEVTSGPANKPLSSYEAKIEGDLVLVKAA